MTNKIFLKFLFAALYFLTEIPEVVSQTCTPEIENCLECSTENKCTKCCDNFWIFTHDNSCSKVCGAGFNSTGTIDSGQESCFKCTDVDANCLHCGVNEQKTKMCHTLCKDKFTSCEKCSDDGLSCLKCPSGNFIMSESFNCVASCPDGFYPTGVSSSGDAFCNSCHKAKNENCSSCELSNSNVKCLSCKSPSLLSRLNDPLGECIETCPSPTSLSLANRTPPELRCAPCDELLSFCSECNSEGTQCLKCKTNNYFIENTGLCTNNCSQGYVTNENKCIPCNISINNCNSCHLDGVSGLICDSCVDKFFKNATQACLSECPISTYSKEITSNGSSICLPCSESCAACSWNSTTNQTECRACDPSKETKYLLTLNRTCVSNCTLEGYIECKDNCGTLNLTSNPYFLDKDTFKCAKCSFFYGDYCKTCNTTNCISCNTGYFLNYIGQCLNYDTCSIDGYTFNDTNTSISYCKLCNETFGELCDSCAFNLKTNELSCSSCKKPYMMVQNSTYPVGKCLQGFEGCSSYSNYTYYPKNSSKLYRKNESCISCEWQVPNCISCQEYKGIDNIWLVPDCKQCKEYYTSASVSCIACPKNCKKCRGYTSSSTGLFISTCEVCDEGHLINSNCEPYSKCSGQDRYVDLSDFSCKFCANTIKSCTNCIWNNETRAIDCLGCSANNYYHRIDKNCTENCTGLLPLKFGDSTKNLGRCISCEEGLSIKGCSVCNQTSPKCSGCTSPYFLSYSNNSSGECVEKCPNITFYTNVTLRTCPMCNQNINFCKECSEDGLACSLCEVNTFIHSETKKCLQTCDEGLVQGKIDSGLAICTPCSQNISNCRTCQSSQGGLSCTRCFNGSWLNSSNMCVDYCSSGFYADLTEADGTGRCRNCSHSIPSCVSCEYDTNLRAPVCKACDTPLFLDITGNKSGVCQTQCLTPTHFPVTQPRKECLLCSKSKDFCLECSSDGKICLKCSKFGIAKGTGDALECEPCESKITNCSTCYLNNTDFVCDSCISPFALDRTQV
jgi:hypothetical protein